MGAGGALAQPVSMLKDGLIACIYRANGQFFKTGPTVQTLNSTIISDIVSCLWDKGSDRTCTVNMTYLGVLRERF